jgi:hypothetical protein
LKKLGHARQPGLSDTPTVAALGWHKTLYTYETGAMEGSMSQTDAVLNE